jgi:antitoxin component YwqK of YwqJK toxin-antitoxin module
LKEYYENNQLEEVIEYNKNGEFSSIREYYKNGQLKHEINYDENGEISGEWKIYYDNGQLMVIAKYHNDKFIDIISYFDNKGNKLYKGTIKNGNGTVNHYDETGRLIKIITYINGEIKE